MKDLTRIYRPKEWDSIVGQEALVKTLQTEIKNDDVGQAYLFCGPRGTGKTTTARVFANHLNAQIIELDAASNNGVDHIRDLRQDVTYLPADGASKKVYIIDEVHMLSASAQNAFLKVLEEPPAHVIFILATTDPQKILSTIISRVQRFDLKRIAEQDIINRLDYIAKQEQISIEPDALKYIAKSVDGGMRDAIKLMQKCCSLDDTVTVQTVITALGSVDVKHIQTVVDDILRKDIKSLLVYFNDLVAQGIDIKIFLSDTVQYLANTMSDKIINNDKKISAYFEIADGLLSLLYSMRNITQLKTLTELKFISLCCTKEEEQKTDPDAEKRQAVNETIQRPKPESKPDQDVYAAVMEKLTNMEKRMTAHEMQHDMERFRR